MRIYKLLAKLTAQGFDPESAAMPPGGGPGITPQDIAHALSYARISPMAKTLAWAKGAKDEKMQHELTKQLAARIYARLIRWKVKNPEEIGAQIAELVMSEYVVEPPCPQCGGRQERKYRGVWQACPTCQGTGRKIYRDAEKARKIGVHKSNWLRTWAGRYSECARPITESERELQFVDARIGWHDDTAA